MIRKFAFPYRICRGEELDRIFKGPVDSFTNLRVWVVFLLGSLNKNSSDGAHGLKRENDTQRGKYNFLFSMRYVAFTVIMAISEHRRVSK